MVIASLSIAYGPAAGQRLNYSWPPGREILVPALVCGKWFGHDPVRWVELQTRYRTQLADPERTQALDALAAVARSGRLTFVYGARDREHNQAQVIADETAHRLDVAP